MRAGGTVVAVGRSDAALVVAARGGEDAAFAELFERWFDRCFDVARNVVRNDDHAADVAQDVFLTAWQRLDQLDDPERFGGWLLRISRNKALNRLQKEGRRRPMEGSVMTDLHDRDERDDPVGSNRLTDTEDLSEIRARQELVWAAAAGLGVREASILDLHLRHHLSAAEIADELDITANNAHQLLYRLRQKLGDVIGNHQLWRNGQPRCVDLASLQIAAFDEAGNRAVQRHRSSCDVCAAEHRAVIDPQKLFAAVPVAVAPLLLRERAAAALEAQGVPVRDAGTPAEGSGDTGSGSDRGSGDDRAIDQHGVIDQRGVIDQHGVIEQRRGHRRRGRGRRRALSIGAAVAAVVAVAFLWARPAGDPALEVAATAPSTSAPSTDPAAPTTAAPTTEVPTTAEPPVTEPPVTEPPVTEPPVTEPPVTEPPETEPPDSGPDPAIAAPEILRFTVGDPQGVSLRCANRDEVPRRAIWAVDGGAVIELAVGGQVVDVTTAEQHLFCAVPGTELRLTASNSGGVDEQVISS